MHRATADLILERPRLVRQRQAAVKLALVVEALLACPDPACAVCLAELRFAHLAAATELGDHLVRARELVAAA